MTRSLIAAPAGAEEAGARNRAAVEVLQADAATTVGAAVKDMLAAVLADLTTGVPSVPSVTARARSAWTAALARIVAWVRDTFGRLVVRAAGTLPDPLSDDYGVPDLAPRTVTDYVAAVTRQLATDLADVPDVVASRTATALEAGYAAGETPQELRARVADAMDGDQWSAEVERIARTTTTAVYNAAHTAVGNDLQRQLGRPLRRMWIATQDARTRETHRKAHAQVIEAGDQFRVGRARLRFPGDPLGPADEIVQCRCVAVAVLDDVVIDLAHRAAGREADVLNEPLAAAGLTPAQVAAIVAELVAVSRMPPAFQAYWSHGAGAAKIRWGTSGDFKRCERALARYIKNAAQIPGACNSLHKLATGVYPGQEASAEPEAVAADTEEGADMPCPCENLTDDQLDAAAKALAAAPPPFPPKDKKGAPANAPADTSDDSAGDCPCADDHDVADEDCPCRDTSGTDAPAEPDAVDGAPDAPTGDEPADPAGAPDQPDQSDVDDAGEEDALEDARTGAMVALVPAEADAQTLAVDGDGAIPADELHMTLLFLGDGAQWLDGDTPTSAGQDVLDLAQRVAQDVGPYTGQVWQIGATGEDTPTGGTAMYLIGDDTGRLAELHAGLVMAGNGSFPDQHSPWVAHVSTRYGNAATDGMAAMGSQVTFDRLRVVFAGQATDFPLTGDDSLDDVGDDTEAPAEPSETDVAASTATARTDPSPTASIAADAGQEGPPHVALAAAVVADQIVARAAESAPQTPPGEWFRPVQVDGPTPPTVTAEGRVWGHIGQAVNEDGSLRYHVGFPGENVPIPPTRTNYGAFHRDQVVTAEGDTADVGYLYTGCHHSPTGPDATLDSAREHLESACMRTAVGRVYDDQYGPMFVGSVVPGASAGNVAQLWKLSGEWFTAPLELHAAVGVEDAGFPVEGTGDEVRTADAAPPLAAGAHQVEANPVAAIQDYQRRRTAVAAGAVVLTAAKARAQRVLSTYSKRG